MVTAILILFLIVVVAGCGWEGMWSNAIRLVNVTLAALLATNFFQPFAGWLEGRMTAISYHADMAALLLLFAGFMMLLRTITDRISTIKIRFLPIVDRIGGALLAAWTGWIVVCFLTMALHTTPLGRNFLWGSFRPEERMFFGTAPDRKWLGLMQKASLGSLARGGTQQNPEARAFDPQGLFIPMYASRRSEYEQLDTLFRRAAAGRGRR